MRVLARSALVLALVLPSIASGQVGIQIDDVEAAAGDQVVLGVRLTAEGTEIAAAQNELQLPAGVLVNACTANRAIGKEATLFNYLPRGCDQGVDCSGVRVLVFSLRNTSAIPDGSLLYSCTVAIADTAPAGSVLEIGCDDPGTSTADGEPVDTACSDGAITVVEPPSTPCIGDCDGDERVVVSELLAGVNVLLERASVESCLALDRDLDDTVSVDELVAAISQALRGCPE